MRRCGRGHIGEMSDFASEIGGTRIRNVTENSGLGRSDVSAETVVAGVDGGLGATAHVELGEDVLDVGGDRAPGDEEAIGSGIVGPFLGDSAWRQVKQRLRVPADAREGIFRIGLFGATGEISFDNVRISKVE